MKFLVRYIKRILLILATLLLILWGTLAYFAWNAEPLQPWHTFVPKELTIQQINNANWSEYIDHEVQLFDTVYKEVTQKLEPEARTSINRFYEGALVYPPSLATNWNQSYIMEPEGEIVGAVVLLHGLTDTPYSLRHIAKFYADQGFVALGIRLPGHGTVPGGLTTATWEDWHAATKLAVREAKKRAGKNGAVHVVGFSTGGALAVKYAMDTLEDPSLTRPDRLILVSPMIGITRFARFVGITAVPAILPAFANAAWLSVLPEFNPFKYNSFPVHAARQSHLLTQVLQEQIQRLSRTENFATLPPILTFQSVLDYTVSTPAILYSLYAYLPDNGSELVLYDINRATLLGPLVTSTADAAVTRMIPKGAPPYMLSIVSNRSPNDLNTAEFRVTDNGSLVLARELDTPYPLDIFSLSHVALPFPMDDPLYGIAPETGSEALYGISLGRLGLRGERGALIVTMDTMLRMSSNPFFPLQLEKIKKGIEDPRPHPHAPMVLPMPKTPKEAQELMDNFLRDVEKTRWYNEAEF